MSSVTVVIPTLNEQDNIGVLLDALRRQERPADEIIVVDAGSKDNTVGEVSCFPEIRLLNGSPPVGSQRQLGLEQASGDIVVFLDADTTPEPGFIRRALAEMESRHLDAACPWYSPFPSNLLISAVYAFFNVIFIAVQRIAPSGAGSCIIAKRDFALEIGGIRNDLVYEDIEFIRRSGRRGRFGMLRQRLRVSDRRFREFGTLRMFLKYMSLSFFFSFGLFRLAGVIGYPFGKYSRRSEETVVLVDENDTPIGQAPKRSVHGPDTPLHRGFSLFLFNPRGEVLLQRRSSSKTTWPDQWSNSCCGHPSPEERPEDAARRRAAFELGLMPERIQVVLPHYRYRAEFGGVVENETCPVLVGVTDREPAPNPDEVSDVRWVNWNAFLDSVRKGEPVTPWCAEEAELLGACPAFHQALQENAG